MPTNVFVWRDYTFPLCVCVHMCVPSCSFVPAYGSPHHVILNLKKITTIIYYIMFVTHVDSSFALPIG